MQIVNKQSIVQYKAFRLLKAQNDEIRPNRPDEYPPIIQPPELPPDWPEFPPIPSS